MDLHAWQVLAPLAGHYLPWSSWSMRPSGLVTVLNDAWVHARRAVVECGGGVSTLFLARLLSRQGGRLCTLESDAAWACLLEAQLARENLTPHAQVVHAPLEPHPAGWDGAPWYAVEPVRAALGDTTVDLLVVDGPPGHRSGLEHARYPALGWFLPRLATNCTVVLDDVDRPGEQAILDRWERETPLRFDRRPVHSGLAIGRRPGYTALDV